MSFLFRNINVFCDNKHVIGVLYATLNVNSLNFVLPRKMLQQMVDENRMSFPV